MKLSDFRVLTFDCYGTLIDWESGIFAAMQPLLRKLTTPLSRDAALETFARHESAQEAETPDMVYSQLLTAVHRRLTKEWDVTMSTAGHERFGASVADWPAFPDSPQALAYLKQHYKLVILSNVDCASFAGSNRRLGVQAGPSQAGHSAHRAKPVPRSCTGEAMWIGDLLDRSPPCPSGLGSDYGTGQATCRRLPVSDIAGHG